MKIELDSGQIIITFSERIGIKLNDVLFYVSANIRELFEENIITIKQQFFKRKNNLGNNYIRCGILHDSNDRILQYRNFIHVFPKIKIF